ncbi:hypothetical protein [Ornithinimicrobium kibberense]|uniref:hypothetical protein n=1 Tax=Ornithinimicrobium kibberense TaxID=282060 RepID=UPI00361C7C3D
MSPGSPRAAYAPRRRTAHARPGHPCGRPQNGRRHASAQQPASTYLRLPCRPRQRSAADPAAARPPVRRDRPARQCRGPAKAPQRVHPRARSWS